MDSLQNLKVKIRPSIIYSYWILKPRLRNQIANINLFLERLKEDTLLFALIAVPSLVTIEGDGVRINLYRASVPRLHELLMSRSYIDLPIQREPVDSLEVFFYRPETGRDATDKQLCDLLADLFGYPIESFNYKESLTYDHRTFIVSIASREVMMDLLKSSKWKKLLCFISFNILIIIFQK